MIHRKLKYFIGTVMSLALLTAVPFAPSAYAAKHKQNSTMKKKKKKKKKHQASNVSAPAHVAKHQMKQSREPASKKKKHKKKKHSK